MSNLIWDISNSTIRTELEQLPKVDKMEVSINSEPILEIQSAVDLKAMWNLIP